MFSLVCALLREYSIASLSNRDAQVHTVSLYAQHSGAPRSSFIRSSDVYNKIDAISLETMDRLAHEDHTVVISCEMDLKCVTAGVAVSHY